MDGQTVEIDGDSYKILYLDPLTASDMLTDLSKAIAPALGAVGGKVLAKKDSKNALDELLGGAEGEEDAQALAEAYERAIMGLVDRLDKATFRAMVNELAQVTSVKKGDGWPELKPVMAIHFRGRIKSFYKWFFAALKIQFADFFSGLSPAIAHAAQQVGLGQ